FDGYAGEQAISAFSESTQALLAETPALWRVATLAWAPPQCVTSKAGVEPAFPMVAKYPTSSPPASGEPHRVIARSAATRQCLPQAGSLDGFASPAMMVRCGKPITK